MTTPNPIDEIKQIRHQLGAEVGFDVHRIFDRLRERQAASGRKYILAARSEGFDRMTEHLTEARGQDSA